MIDHLQKTAWDSWLRDEASCAALRIGEPTFWIIESDFRSRWLMILRSDRFAQSIDLTEHLMIFAPCKARLGLHDQAIAPIDEDGKTHQEDAPVLGQAPRCNPTTTSTYP